MSDAVSATIDNGIATISYEHNSRKKTKTIPSEALAKAILAGTSTGKEVTFNPPGLRVHGRCGDKVIVGYEFPERVGDMPFSDQRGSEPYNIKSVWPWGMTFIEFTDTPDGMKWSTFYQFGLKGPITTLDNMMYVWPGSNVFGGHNCCIGDIKVPKLKGIEQTGGMPFIFYNGISNPDLSDHRFTTFTVDGKNIQRPIDLYRHLEVKEGEAPKQFPYDIMMNAKTLKSFLTEKGYM